VLALTGPGAYSLDAWLGVPVPPRLGELPAVVLFGGSLLSLLTRLRLPPNAAERHSHA
jgi:hypothetical protein